MPEPLAMPPSLTVALPIFKYFKTSPATSSHPSKILQINMTCVYSTNQHMADVEKYFPRNQLSQTLHPTTRENHIQAECNT